MSSFLLVFESRYGFYLALLGDVHADLADARANAESYYDDLREQACLESLRERGYL